MSAASPGTTARRLPFEGLALDPGAVAALPALRDLIPDDATVRATVLQRKAKRLVVRYDLEGTAEPASIVGKWYSTDRGALVFDMLRQLRDDGFAPPGCMVPRPIGYEPELRALFVEAVEGKTLRDALDGRPGGARRAGDWLARFHGSRLTSPRDCGPAKQIDSVRRWTRDVPRMAEVAGPLLDLLERRADSTLSATPVHYDYYHAQVILGPGDKTCVVDLDESGLGDPAMDVAHFVAHLRRLGIRHGAGPDAHASSEAAFLEGYASVAPVPETTPAHEAFVWFKLAAQALRRGQEDLAVAALAAVAAGLAA